MAAIVNSVVAGVRPGAIILMHDGGGKRANTIAALPLIIAKLRAMGYGFVTMDQLYSPPPKAPAKPPVPAPVVKKP